MAVVEGNLKAPFSIATTPRCRRGCYSFLWFALLTLDPYLIMLSVKPEVIKNHFFESLVGLDLGLNFWTIGEYSNHYANFQVTTKAALHSH